MDKRFDTAAINFERWRSIAPDAIIPLHYECDRESNFSGILSAHPVGKLQVAHLKASPHSVQRSPRLIHHARHDQLVFNWLLNGQCHVEQDDNRNRVNQGAMWLCDASRQYQLEFPQTFDLISIVLPKEGIKPYFSDLSQLVSLDLSQRSEMASFVSAHLQLLTQTSQFSSPFVIEKVTRHTIDLLVSLFAETLSDQKHHLTHSKASIVMRVKQYIDHHAMDAELTGQEVADKIGVSTRYINQLLSEEGLSLSRLIWHDRVLKSAELLQDNQNTHRSISDIAYTTGFNDVAHFSRTFKKHFSVTPSQYRRQINNPL